MNTYVNGEWPSGADPYRQLIEEGAAFHKVPTLLLAWLLWKESA